MEDNQGHDADKPVLRPPWNKGKLVGAKPPLSRKKRSERAAIVKEKCSRHVLGRMREKLGPLLPMCSITEDDADKDRGSLQVHYLSLLQRDGYLKSWVKIECGARGAMDPVAQRSIVPYVQAEIGQRFDLAIPQVTFIRAERTFWEKALILHGIYCGYRDERQCAAGPRAAGARARFSRTWEKLEEARPGSVRLVPQKDIQNTLVADYASMSGMMFGESPSFDWVLGELRKLEKSINGPAA